METAITVRKIRPLFFTKVGLPKTEVLKDVIDISKDLGIKVNKLTREERAYKFNIINACLKAIRDACRDHHINWLDVKVEGMRRVLHGFSKNPNLWDNNVERCKQREIQYKNVYKTVKSIADDFLLSNGNKTKEIQ